MAWMGMIYQGSAWERFWLGYDGKRGGGDILGGSALGLRGLVLEVRSFEVRISGRGTPWAGREMCRWTVMAMLPFES